MLLLLARGVLEMRPLPLCHLLFPSMPESRREVHKLICECYSKFDKLTRPNEHHRLVFILPADTDKLDLIWLKLKHRTDDD